MILYKALLTTQSKICVHFLYPYFKERYKYILKNITEMITRLKNKSLGYELKGLSTQLYTWLSSEPRALAF